ncbi:arrestin domain-containing protein 17-like [Gigantopelta aegis]|uniref:arrestin domain-containing protein 17-like n=1 Tax=Gigantopelta aegis TaxID=1735272 RepID=UPI001B88E50A|nr:arrestin domain-containing protein 17-like [Gigantopelta aegis]
MAAPSPSVLSLNLEHAELVFYSGEKIRGALVVQLATPVSVAGVELRFRGSARATWRDHVHEGMRRTEVEHEKEEIYFDDRFCLWGKVTDEGHWETREVLKRGRHLFPFQYKLPDGIPCSFEGPNAYVRYTVQGLVFRTSGECLSTQRCVTVLRDLDSKRDTEKRTPSPRHALEDHAERSFSSVCCRPGRVSCSLSIIKRGYVPGETIKTEIHLHNLSMRKSGVCKLQLKQLLTYGDSHSKYLVLEESKLFDAIRPGQRRQLREFPMHVPPTCPSRLSKCRVIDVRYCLALEAHFTDTVLYAAVPVTIATIPEKGILPIRWGYRECIRPINQDSDEPKEGQCVEFEPKYKYYEEIRDIRREKYYILKLRQSPGVRRRQLIAKSELGACAAEHSELISESHA